MKALLVLFCCLCPVFAHAEESALRPWRTVTVNGEGKIKASPDKADLQVTLQREAKTAADAKKQTDALVTTLTRIARDSGIEMKDIRTQSISLQPQYSYQNNEKPLLTGYVASASVAVTVNELSRLGALMEALVKGGIDRIDNITYGVKGEDALKEQALVKALESARRKAGMLAQNLGQALGEPVSINESGTSYNPPVMPMMMRAKAEGFADSAVAPPAGDLEMSASLSATFAFK